MLLKIQMDQNGIYNLLSINYMLPNPENKQLIELLLLLQLMDHSLIIMEDMVSILLEVLDLQLVKLLLEVVMLKIIQLLLVHLKQFQQVQVVIDQLLVIKLFMDHVLDLAHVKLVILSTIMVISLMVLLMLLEFKEFYSADFIYDLHYFNNYSNFPTELNLTNKFCIY